MASKAEYTSDKRIYLDSSGQPVDKSDPDRQTLLVAAGGKIPMAKAVELGLAEAEEGEGTAASAEAGLYTDKEGNVVPAGHPAAQKRVGAKGAAVASEDLSGFTKTELEKIAKKRGVKVSSSMTKDDMVAAIEAGPEEE